MMLKHMQCIVKSILECFITDYWFLPRQSPGQQLSVMQDGGGGWLQTGQGTVRIDLFPGWTSYKMTKPDVCPVVVSWFNGACLLLWCYVYYVQYCAKWLGGEENLWSDLLCHVGHKTQLSDVVQALMCIFSVHSDLLMSFKSFLPCDAMLAHNMLSSCVRLCLSHTGIVSKWLNISSRKRKQLAR